MTDLDSPLSDQKSLELPKLSVDLKSSNTIATINLAEWRLCPTGKMKRMHMSRVDLRSVYCETIMMSLLESNPKLSYTIANHGCTLLAICAMPGESDDTYKVIIRGTSGTMRVFIDRITRSIPEPVSRAIADAEHAVHIACLSNSEMRINMHILFQTVVKKLLLQLQSDNSVVIIVNPISLLEMLITLKRPIEKSNTQLIVSCYSTRLVMSSKCAITEHSRETSRLVTLIKTVYNWSQRFSEDGAVEELSNQSRWPALVEMLS